MPLPPPPRSSPLQLLRLSGALQTALLPAQPRHPLSKGGYFSPAQQQPPLAAKQKGSWDLHFAFLAPVISPTQPPPQAPISTASGDYLKYTCSR